MEEWRDVPGFDGLYKIDISTKEGRCWSCYTSKCLSNKPYKHTGRINWMLYGRNGETVFQQAARWIAITYPELVQNEYFEGAEIDHIDTDPLNNHPSNLRWVDRVGQMNNKLTKQHLSKALTNRTDKSKPVKQYSKSGEFIAEYPSSKEAGRQTGIESGNIRSACLQKTTIDKNGVKHTNKTAGGFIWKYAI